MARSISSDRTSLRTMCCCSIAKTIFSRSNGHFSSFEDSAWNVGSSIVCDILNPIANTVPEELFQAILEEIYLTSSTIALVTSLLFIDRLNSIDMNIRPKMAQSAPVVPLPFLASKMSTITPNITKIDLNSVLIDDSVLTALAASQAASGLKHLFAIGLGLTDKSLTCWQSFNKLSYLSLGECPGLGLASFMALADVSSLVTLEIWNEFDYVPTILGVFLAPGALPELQELLVGGVGVSQCFEDLLIILRQMKAPNRLIRLQIVDIEPFEAKEKLEQIIEICPNLRYDLTGAMLARDYHLLSEPQSARTARLSGPVSQAVIDDIASRFPNLSKLVIEPLGWDQIVDFSGLSCLGSITFKDELCNCLGVSAFPSSLRVLKYAARQSVGGAQKTAVATSVETFCDNVARSCPTLRKIMLQVGGKVFFTKKDIERILSSLHDLEFFCVFASGSYASSSAKFFPISHPKLKFMNKFITADNYQPVPTYVPSIRGLGLTVTDNFEFDFYAPQLNVLNGSWLASNCLNKCITSLHHSSSLKRMRLNLVREAFGSFLETLPSFEGLVELTLIGCELDEMTASAILISLPSLNSIDCALASGVQDWAWLKHPRLTRIGFFGMDALRTQGGESHKGEVYPISSSSSVLRVAGSNLPMLSFLKVHLTKHPVHQIELSDLLALSKVEILGCRHVHDIPYSLAVRNCPLLSSLYLSSMSFGLCTISKVPMLAHLQFVNCRAPRELDHLEDVSSLRCFAAFIWLVPEERHWFERLRDHFKARETDYRPLQASIEGDSPPVRAQ